MENSGGYDARGEARGGLSETSQPRHAEGSRARAAGFRQKPPDPPEGWRCPSRVRARVGPATQSKASWGAAQTRILKRDRHACIIHV